jgi:hypothetical protein
MRASLRRSLVPLIAAFALTRMGTAVAQVAPVPPPPGSEAPAAPGIHPEAVSSFVVRAYTLGSKKLWKGLIQALEKAGYPPEVVDEKKHRVTTSFVDFKAGDYSEAVADPPPRLGAGYHILQMNEIKQGKVSLECIITKGEGGGAVLSLRARLLVEGLDEVKRIRILTDRRSSGVIESDFMRQLEDDLALERR